METPSIREKLSLCWESLNNNNNNNNNNHDIGASNAIEIFSSRPSFGNFASAAGHDIGARNAIENFLKWTNVWRCCECR